MSKILLISEKECFYYLYQLHAAVSILQSADSDKAMELNKQLDVYNQLIQRRLYGSVGMSMDADDAEEESYEDDTL